MGDDCSHQARHIGNEVDCRSQIVRHATSYPQSVIPRPVEELEANDRASQVKPDPRTIAAVADTDFNPAKPSAIKLCVGHVVSSALLDDFLGDFAIWDVD